MTTDDLREQTTTWIGDEVEHWKRKYRDAAAERDALEARLRATLTAARTAGELGRQRRVLLLADVERALDGTSAPESTEEGSDDAACGFVRGKDYDGYYRRERCVGRADHPKDRHGPWSDTANDEH